MNAFIRVNSDLVLHWQRVGLLLHPMARAAHRA